MTVHETVGVGDAENDHAFLSICECSAAVANALPAVTARADIATQGDHGSGVAELIDHIVRNDLADLALSRHDLLLGVRDDGREVRLPAYGANVAIAGPEGSDRSAAVGRFLEQMAAHRYQFCILDPDGDHAGLKGTVALGSHENRPSIEDAMKLLADDRQNTVINLAGLAAGERAAFVASLLPKMQEMRAASERPHWLVVEDAHALLPATLEKPVILERRTLFITSRPKEVTPTARNSVGTVLAVGPSGAAILHPFGQAAAEATSSQPGQALLWNRAGGERPFHLRIAT
jgi:hypothetical protein